jgi:hypothetical protein
MSPEEFFKKGVSQISAGKRIRRGEKSIFKQRRSSPALKSKTNEESKSKKNEMVQDKDGETKGEKEYHIDVII